MFLGISRKSRILESCRFSGVIIGGVEILEIRKIWKILENLENLENPGFWDRIWGVKSGNRGIWRVKSGESGSGNGQFGENVGFGGQIGVWEARFWGN